LRLVHRRQRHGCPCGPECRLNNNTLVISGTFTANQITIGPAGNTGNKLIVNGSTASGSAVTLDGGILRTGATTGFSNNFGALSVNSPSTIALGSRIEFQLIVADTGELIAGESIIAANESAAASIAGFVVDAMEGTNRKK
jgi:hypothetical protein